MDDTVDVVVMDGPMVHLFGVSPELAQRWLDLCWPLPCTLGERCSTTGVVVVLVDDGDNVAGMVGCAEHRHEIDELIEKNSDGIDSVDVGVLPRRIDGICR